MAEENATRGSMQSSNKITLKRGNRVVTYEKVPNQFAVRLKQGRAQDPEELKRNVGEVETAVEHVDADLQEAMDVFTVAEAAKLEEIVDKMRKAPAAEIVTHTYKIDESSGGAMIPTGTLTIQFKPDVLENRQVGILAEFGLEIVENLDFLPNGYTVALTEEASENPLKIAFRLQQREEIETAEPDLSFQVALKYVPTDTLYNEQWHLNNQGNRIGLVANADVKAEAAWDITRGKRSITVCVIDDGYDLGHPDFNVGGKIVSPRDLFQDDHDPSPVFFDDNHGTACAGVAIAEENGIGVVGLAPGCAFMPVRMALTLSDNAVVTLFKHAIDHHADIISCSWSAAAWNFPLSTKIHAIIRHAATQGRHNGKGCVILFAAGNENRPLDGVKNGHISHQGFALHPDVIAVGASNSRDERSDYSNFGPELTICAPSSGDPGRRIVTTDRRGVSGYSAGDYTFTFGGTSSATPLAAGLAALILSVDEELTSAEVRQIMMDTADKIDQAHGEYVDGHSPWYGHGRIHAHRALVSVLGEGEGGEQRFESLFLEHRVNRPIADLGVTEDPIIFPLDVAVGEIEVHLDIQHSRPQDLRVSLETPQSDELLLVDGTNGLQDGITKIFHSSNEPELFAPVIGASAQGSWHLKVVATAAQEVGEIVKWGLTVTY
jgi:subtilisin family serine protease/subtilisin-like proprotein convertase family protein